MGLFRWLLGGLGGNRDGAGGKGRASAKVPAWAHTGAVNIGLDFGTYSTKAVLRARNDPRGLVLVVDPPTPGYPPYASPSLVRLSRGQLYFGREALRLTDGRLFRSLKMDLLGPTRSGWPPGEFPDGTTPDLLVAAYLAWVLGRIKGALGEVPANRVSLNVAAPMSQVENRALKVRYLHVVHAAWQAAFGGAAAPVEQGAEWTAVRPVFRELIDRDVPDITARRFEVLPETLAPLVSLLRDPRTARGLYLMIDMGAGTTELSVSYVTDSGQDAARGAITCYADCSTPLGGDMFAASDHHGGEEALRKRLRKLMHDVWYGGFEKVKDGGFTARETWKTLIGVLAGGGLLRPGLEYLVTSYNPMTEFVFKHDTTNYKVDWHQPDGLNFDLVPAGLDPASHSVYLAVANGLSVESQRWAVYFPPAQVAPVVMPPKPQDPYERRYSESDVG